MFPWVVNAALITQNPANFQQKLVDEPGVALLHSYPLKAYEFYKLAPAWVEAHQSSEPDDDEL
jgi:hypothetical protein